MVITPSSAVVIVSFFCQIFITCARNEGKKKMPRPELTPTINCALFFLLPLLSYVDRMCESNIELYYTTYFLSRIKNAPPLKGWGIIL